MEDSGGIGGIESAAHGQLEAKGKVWGEWELQQAQRDSTPWGSLGKEQAVTRCLAWAVGDGVGLVVSEVQVGRWATTSCQQIYRQEIRQSDKQTDRKLLVVSKP